MSDASNAAIVRTGPLQTGASRRCRFGPRAPAALPTTVAAATPAPTRKPREHRVARGETLVSIAQRKFQCDTKSLAKANALKAPRYAIRPGRR